MQPPDNTALPDLSVAILAQLLFLSRSPNRDFTKVVDASAILPGESAEAPEGKRLGGSDRRLGPLGVGDRCGPGSKQRIPACGRRLRRSGRFAFGQKAALQPRAHGSRSKPSHRRSNADDWPKCGGSYSASAAGRNAVLRSTRLCSACTNMNRVLSTGALLPDALRLWRPHLGDGSPSDSNRGCG
jgi:hypothetical protein